MSFVLLISVLLNTPTVSSMVLPNNLDRDARQQVVKTLGIPTSSKLLTNPYPLGGYSGFEIGVGYQLIDTQKIAKLSSLNKDSDDKFALAEITVGKGLFNNLDIFFHFAPFSHESDAGSFGGFVKWGFYQAKFIPLNLSLAFHGSTFHLGDQFVHETLGLELLAGINVENIAIYFGGGSLQGEGTFMGGSGRDSTFNPLDDDIDKTIQTTTENVFSKHVFVGLSLHLSDLFLALQLDRYDEPTISGKIGLRL